MEKDRTKAMLMEHLTDQLAQRERMTREAGHREIEARRGVVLAASACLDADPNDIRLGKWGCGIAKMHVVDAEGGKMCLFCGLPGVREDD
jgi:hypothetical protein